MAMKELAFACFMLLAFVGNAASKKLYITADDEITELYLNGVLTPVGPGGNPTWSAIREVDLPDSLSVIAIKASDIYGVVAGILASSDDGSILTDSSWKCTTDYTAGWESSAFDDSAWPAAFISGTNTASDVHKYLSPISPNAKWIWTKNFDYPIDTPVYCRLGLNIIDEYTCIGCSNPCTPENIAAGKFYFKYTDNLHFVQCSQWGRCYVMPCGAGTVWNQSKLTCDWP